MPKRWAVTADNPELFAALIIKTVQWRLPTGARPAATEQTTNGLTADGRGQDADCGRA